MSESKKFSRSKAFSAGVASLKKQPDEGNAVSISEIEDLIDRSLKKFRDPGTLDSDKEGILSDMNGLALRVTQVIDAMCEADGNVARHVYAGETFIPTLYWPTRGREAELRALADKRGFGTSTILRMPKTETPGRIVFYYELLAFIERVEWMKTVESNLSLKSRIGGGDVGSDVRDRAIKEISSDSDTLSAVGQLSDSDINALLDTPDFKKETIDEWVSPLVKVLLESKGTKFRMVETWRRISKDAKSRVESMKSDVEYKIREDYSLKRNRPMPSTLDPNQFAPELIDDYLKRKSRLERKQVNATDLRTSAKVLIKKELRSLIR